MIISQVSYRTNGPLVGFLMQTFIIFLFLFSVHFPEDLRSPLSIKSQGEKLEPHSIVSIVCILTD